MSSNKRPWYKWYPRDFNQDEKVKGLGWDAELIYRRLLDVMWQSNDCQLPNDIDYLHNAVAIAIPKKRFATAWLQIQRENFKLFTEENGNICSERLKIEMDAVRKLSKTRRKLGQKGGVAKAKAIAKQKLYQKGSDTDTDTDIKRYSPNSNEFRLSRLLFSLIKKRNPKQKKPNLQKWAAHIDKIIRIDTRKPIEIENVIMWCQDDDFWQNNILSTERLRKQFDKLWLKMNKGNYSQPEQKQESVEEMCR